MEDKKYFSLTDNVFSIQETDEKNVLLFYRNDGAPLSDITREPMVLYQAYIAHKMFSGEITTMVMSNISYKISNDEKCLILIIDEHRSEIDAPKESNKDCDSLNDEKSTASDTNPKNQNFFKRLIEKIFK